MASVNFVPSADASVVSAHSRAVLSDILDDAKLASCVITSTVRTPAGQARAMFINIEKTGVETQMKLYGKPGQQVIGEYKRLKPLGCTRPQILDAMESKTVALGPGTVSRHCADPSKLNVVDIAPSSIASPQRFLAALQRARQRGVVSKYFSPANGDPAFHVEIPQPGQA